jgi:inner membrane protein
VVPRRNREAAAVLAGIAIAPDLDLLLGVHREASHSVGAAVIVGVVSALLWFAFAPPPLKRHAHRAGLAAALAWGSHVLLDWLSNDTRPPIGVMALWPFAHDYYKAAIEIFPPVSRRYWESRFWLYNLRAIVTELSILGPLAAFVIWRSRRAH